MTSYALKLIPFGSVPTTDKDWGYLESVDFESHAPGKPYPTGTVICTRDPAQAMRFATLEDAFECWRQPSLTCPLRPDGKPNRPLTAFHAEIVTLE